MAKDKRDRRANLLGNLNRQRFEQEVAEEIGISLNQRTGRASRRARSAAASPGAGATLTRKARDEEGPAEGP